MRNMVFRNKYGLICSAVLACFIAVSTFLLKGTGFTGPVSDSSGLLFSVLSWSAGKEGFLITTALLCLVPFALRWSRDRILVALLCFGFVLGGSLVTKTVLKKVTQEPRPYSQVLTELGKVDSEAQFYQITPSQREEVVKSAEGLVSHWRLQHWQGETNYSFPSGHTIFAAAVAVFWGGLLLAEGYRLSAMLIVGWAGMVATSRLWLGMHWPADLFGSVAFATVICLLVPVFVNVVNRVLHRRKA